MSFSTRFSPLSVGAVSSIRSRVKAWNFSSRARALDSGMRSDSRGRYASSPAEAFSAKNWIAFRNYDGAQLIYFTQLVTMKCGLKEVRFSLNGPSLEHTFELPKCNWQVPFNVGADTIPYLSMPLNTAKSISVQVTYADGEKSRIYTYKPCDVDGDTTCAQLVE